MAMTERTGRAPCAFRLNLEQQKNRAKDLLRAAKAGEQDALARFAALDTGATNAPGGALKLADAQLVIARELRFASWAKLKSHIASMELQRAAIAQHEPAPDGATKTLHVRCGHDIQHTLEHAGFTGDFHPHIAPYCQGPVTNGPDRHELMARFVVEGFADLLSDSKPLDYESVLAGELREEELLRRTADDYERVVLWMEYDNYDQLALARLLAHYSNTRRPRVLELVLVDEFPGGDRFLGVGQLPPEALRMLWRTRKPVTQAQLALGREVWDALSSPDPRPLAAIGRRGTSALPTMAPALLRQLRELPDIQDGLSFTQRQILQIVAEEGTVSLNALFWTLLKREPLFFIGDAGVARVVKEMERAAEPALSRTIETPGERAFRNKLTLTEAGRAVLDGTRDWHSLKPLSRWVAGVHVLSGLPGWRWDERQVDAVWHEPGGAQSTGC
jgi:Domain of unknown function (DUF1835)